MRTFLYLHLFFCLTLIASCGNSDRENAKMSDSKKTENAESNGKLNQEEIEQIDYDEYLLSTDAQKRVASWMEYQELNSNIELMKKGDFSFFDKNEEELNIFLDDLKDTVPLQIQSNAVNARILALRTNLYRAHDTFNLKNSKKVEKLDVLKSIFIALSNLNLQINKKLEFEANNAISI